jgi:hypothetical protein
MAAVTNIFSVLCRLEYIERMEKYRWQRIALRYHPREEGTQMENVKNGKDAGASRKVKSWQEEEEGDGRGFITVFAIVRQWDLPYVTTHTNTANVFKIYFNIILPHAIGLLSLHSGFSTKIFRVPHSPLRTLPSIPPWLSRLNITSWNTSWCVLAWPPVTLYL